MTIHTRCISMAAVMALAVAIPLSDTYALYSSQQGNIAYITGGIGDEERDAMQAVKNQYNLSVMSAQNSGAFVGYTEVRITDQQGRELVDTEAGPLFYAQLPPGRYIVEGSSRGQTRKQTISVTQGKPAHVHFSWK